MARIFLCHASEDKPQVREVYQRLKALGFEPWLDEEEILPGQDWDYEIETALAESDFVLVFLSERSVGKIGYVQREFRRAMYHSEEMPEGYIHTIPIKLDACTVPRRFSRHQWANLDEDGAFDRIVRALHRGFEQRGIPVPEAPVVSAPEPLSGQSTSPPPQQVNVVLPQTRLIESIGMELILIPAGTFMMGTSREQLDAIAGGNKGYRDWIENETPHHQVETSRPFYLGKYPVTQRQWERVMGSHPSHFKGDNLPVESVSWEDAQAFMKKLNEREGVDLYRLPTEAEWEYACRAGSTGLYSFGEEVSQLGEYAWYDKNSDGETHPVGEKSPNAWGLYDMHGNVWEWVQDWYAADYYEHSPRRDPQGPDTGADRVGRGGGWSGAARFARSAFRDGLPPGARYVGLGFRCLSSGPSK